MAGDFQTLAIASNTFRSRASLVLPRSGLGYSEA